MASDGKDTIATRISRALADRIVSGELEPGAPLRQDHIAEEFSASHVPVREAFRLLEAQGLAVSQPRRGFRVASFERAEVQEIAEMRAALEALALRHSAPHLTAAMLDRAEAAIRAGEMAGNVRDWEAANRTFHRLIIEPCGMPRLLAAIDDLQAVSARILFAGWRAQWEARTDSDHRAILTALRRGDTDAAASLLASHIRKIGRLRHDGPGHTGEAFVIVG